MSDTVTYPGQTHVDPAAVEDDCSEMPEAMTFGRFEVFPAARTLLFAGAPVCLGARAFDLLILLLSSRGKVVSKEAIMQFVWPTTTVDESNLRFQMGVLRKALGASRGVIKTIPGRGYLLAAEVGFGTKSDFAVRALPHASELNLGQRVICEALCTLLVAIQRHSAAALSVESLLADYMPSSLAGQIMIDAPKLT